MIQKVVFFLNTLMFSVVILAFIAATKSAENDDDARQEDSDTPESDGASWTLTDANQGVEITFFGNGLSGNPATGAYTGTVTSIAINKIGAPGKVSTIQLPVATSLQDLADAATSISGTPNPRNSKPFYDLLMPKGSPFPDLDFTGSIHDDMAVGFGGDDIFELKGGNDTVFASKGDDTLLGGNGSDTFSARYFTAAVDINLKTGMATYGAHGASLTSIENAVGTNKDDKLTGNGKVNSLHGRKGDDVIGGGSGNDELFGDQGKDVLRGGAGKDMIEGGTENDRMFGGGAADTFLFNGKTNFDNGIDRIKDWQTGIDKINIAGGKKSEISVSQRNGDTHVNYDEGKVILDDLLLTKSDIDFTFLL